MFNQKEYDEQNKEKIKQRKKKYYIKNREKILLKSKKYNMEHKEERLQYIKKWTMDNAEKVAKYRNRYQKSMKSLEYQRKYREENREKILEWQRMWRINNSQKAKAIAIKHSNKRKRNLGFAPLNKYFDNAVAHHIDKIHIIYIPEGLHKSIIHCLETGQNMRKINKLSMNFI